MNELSLLQRKQLERHQAWAATRGIPKGNVRPMTLKLYAKLSANTDILRFTSDVQSTSPAPLDTEVRLRRDSLMFVNMVGLALHKVVVNAAGRKFPQNTALYFYPDKGQFPAAVAAGGVFPEWGCLEALYNGKLTMKTNQSIRLEEFPCNIFRDVPTTQSATAAHPGQNMRMVDLSTSMYMFGHRDNAFTIDLGQNSDRVTIGGTAPHENYAVLLLQGFEVVDGAKATLKIDDLESFSNQR